jgi:AcrR family transcriptional regulator
MTAGRNDGLRARRRRRTQDLVIDTALRMFVAKGFDAVTVEEIAAAAEISPRTFYRYFPAKEDVLVADPDVGEVLRDRLRQGRRPAESDVDFVVRAMTTAMAARRPERLELATQLFHTTAAFRTRIEQFVWHDQDPIVEALLEGRPRTADVELRARIVVHAVSHTIRLAVADWMRGDRAGDLQQVCARAVRTLREALTE